MAQQRTGGQATAQVDQGDDYRPSATMPTEHWQLPSTATSSLLGGELAASSLLRPVPEVPSLRRPEAAPQRPAPAPVAAGGDQVWQDVMIAHDVDQVHGTDLSLDGLPDPAPQDPAPADSAPPTGLAVSSDDDLMRLRELFGFGDQPLGQVSGPMTPRGPVRVGGGRPPARTTGHVQPVDPASALLRGSLPLVLLFLAVALFALFFAS